MLQMKMLAAAAALAIAGTAASAATVTPTTGPTPGALNFSTAVDSGDGGLIVGDFLFTPTNTTSGSGAGNCGPAGGTCLQFNPQQTTTMTTYPTGGVFNLSSLSFVLDGQQAELGVFNLSFGAPGTLIISADVDPNGPQTCSATATFCVSSNTWYDLDFQGAADGVTTLLFDNIGAGNVRIGNIVASTVPQPAPIPLPASALLLVGGVGGLAVLRRRKKVA